MNKQEFDEMREEFAVIIYNYEKFLKDNILLDYRYNVAFYEKLKKIRYLEVENGLLSKCVQVKVQGTGEDTDDIIKKVKEGFANEVPMFERKHQIATVVIRHLINMKPEDTEAFEKLYPEFIAKCHPAVKVLVSEEEKKAYENLKIYYYENNYEGFLKAYEEKKPIFQEPEYTEELYAKISEYYYDVRKNIGQDFTRKQKMYPFTKREVFKDEMTVAQEDSELKIQHSKLIRDNKQLHENFIKVFGNDIKLIDEKQE